MYSIPISGKNLLCSALPNVGPTVRFKTFCPVSARKQYHIIDLKKATILVCHPPLSGKNLSCVVRSRTLARRYDLKPFVEFRPESSTILQISKKRTFWCVIRLYRVNKYLSCSALPNFGSTVRFKTFCRVSARKQYHIIDLKKANISVCHPPISVKNSPRNERRTFFFSLNPI